MKTEIRPGENKQREAYELSRLRHPNLLNRPYHRYFPVTHAGNRKEIGRVATAETEIANSLIEDLPMFVLVVLMELPN